MPAQSARQHARTRIGPFRSNPDGSAKVDNCNDLATILAAKWKRTYTYSVVRDPVRP
jgi:hypothetical protein